MVMDYLRSCYTTKCRFFADSDTEVSIRWYWCKPEALVFPHYSRFGSGNWASDPYNWPGPGEVEGALRPYSKGETPAWADGQKYCGSREEFASGLIAASGRRVGYRADGAPCCCVGLVCPNILGDGGSAGGGAAVFNPPCHTFIFETGVEVPCLLFVGAFFFNPGTMVLVERGFVHWTGTEWLGTVGGLRLHLVEELPHSGGYFADSDGACVLPTALFFRHFTPTFDWLGSWLVVPSPGCGGPTVTNVIVHISAIYHPYQLADGGSVGGGVGDQAAATELGGAGGSAGDGVSNQANGFVWAAAGGSRGAGIADESYVVTIAGARGSAGDGTSDQPVSFITFIGAGGSAGAGTSDQNEDTELDGGGGSAGAGDADFL